MKKNLVLIMVDQLRYDCLHFAGNSIISTPNLDQLAATGTFFTQAYSAVPSCVPARATLMTGLHAKNHGKVGYEDGTNWDYQTTLAHEFAKRGYYSKCVGKMHVSPPRKLCGYHHIDLHDGYLHHNRKYHQPYNEQFQFADDYLDWYKEQKGVHADLTDVGLDCNSWVARPWAEEERLHPTNWVVTKGIEFLRKRDTTMPFFLKLSFTRPHSPLDPPSYYFDLYKDKVDSSMIGSWEEETEFAHPTFSTIAKMGVLPLEDKKRAIAAYYGLITHIDHQIGRFMIALEEHQLLENTIIAFVSDHGDQLGEHHLYRKGFPYQGSIHIPLIIKGNGIPTQTVNHLVELCDLMPTLVSLASNEAVTANIDGHDLSDYIKGNKNSYRDYLHGEHEMGEYSSQFILTQKYKYIWYSHTGKEQLFDLEEDPNELRDIKEQHQEVLQDLRQLLIDELEDREEGFVHEKQLVTTTHTKPILEQKDEFFRNTNG